MLIFKYDASTVENSLVVPQKVKPKTHIVKTLTPRYIPKRIENKDSNTCLRIFITALFTRAKG